MTSHRIWVLCLFLLSIASHAQVNCPSLAITQQPTDVTACVGETAMLSVQATGDGPLTYQWRKNCLPLFGETGASLTINSVELSDYASYSVTVTDNCGVLTSVEVFIKPDEIEITGIINDQTGYLRDLYYCEGTELFVPASVSGDNLSYQWRLNCDPLPGEAGSEIEVSALNFVPGDTLDCVVVNGCVSVTVPVAILYNFANVPDVSLQPESSEVCVGDDTFIDLVSSNNAINFRPVTWFKDDVVIQGQTRLRLEITDFQPDDAGFYRAESNEACGTFDFDPVQITAINSLAIMDQPTSQTLCLGSELSLTVATENGSNPTFSWRKGGQPIAGATNASLVIAAITADDAGDYDVVVSDDCGTEITSMAATVIVQGGAITSQPADLAACPNDPFSLTVGVSGPGPFTYQWQKDGMDLVGETAAVFNVAAASLSDEGSYACVVTTPCGMQTSQVASVVVNEEPIITSQPSYCPQPAGTMALLEISSLGQGDTYQWRKDGDAISGATSASLIFTSLSNDDVGTFDCVVTNSCGSIASDAVAVSLVATPMITSQPQSSEVCISDPLTLSVTVSGDGPFNYQWRKGCLPIAGATTATLELTSFSASDVSDYACVITFCGGSLTSEAASLSIDPSCSNNLAAWIVDGIWSIEQGSTMAIDANDDNVVTTQEIEMVTGLLDLSGLQLTDYTGIEQFINLSELDLSQNQLVTIPDLSALASLERLFLNQNKLGETGAGGFSTLPANLQTLEIQNNLLTSLPSLMALTQLNELVASYNRLTNLQTLFNENTIGSNAQDLLDVSFNLLAGTDSVTSENCDAVSDFVTRTNASGASFSYNPQYNFALYAEWPSFTVDVRTLLTDGTLNLDCSGSP